jgi:hypothetical protein
MRSANDVAGNEGGEMVRLVYQQLQTHVDARLRIAEKRHHGVN